MTKNINFLVFIRAVSTSDTTAAAAITFSHSLTNIYIGQNRACSIYIWMTMYLLSTLIKDC